MDKESSPRKAVIIGGGPVGCLSAMALAKQGWTVEIYEGRPGGYFSRGLPCVLGY